LVDIFHVKWSPTITPPHVFRFHMYVICEYIELPFAGSRQWLVLQLGGQARDNGHKGVKRPYDSKCYIGDRN